MTQKDTLSQALGELRPFYAVRSIKLLLQSRYLHGTVCSRGDSGFLRW